MSLGAGPLRVLARRGDLGSFDAPSTLDIPCAMSVFGRLSPMLNGLNWIGQL
jgi:hypothetical protein